MKDSGLNVKIHCDIETTGFDFCGNEDNYSTWMDKMENSESKRKNENQLLLEMAHPLNWSLYGTQL